jgi:hypothetical protein
MATFVFVFAGAVVFAVLAGAVALAGAVFDCGVWCVTDWGAYVSWVPEAAEAMTAAEVTAAVAVPGQAAEAVTAEAGAAEAEAVTAEAEAVTAGR